MIISPPMPSGEHAQVNLQAVLVPVFVQPLTLQIGQTMNILTLALTAVTMLSAREELSVFEPMHGIRVGEAVQQFAIGNVNSNSKRKYLLTY